jgi:hypothetical protein
MSTSGKSASVDRALTRAVVAAAHDVSSAGVADGSGVDFAASGAKRALRYGTTWVRKTSFACVVFVECGAASMNATNLARTVSSGGTWVKRMGSRERAFTAGVESEAWGCAIQE